MQNGQAFKNTTVNTFDIKNSTVHNANIKLCTGLFNVKIVRNSLK